MNGVALHSQSPGWLATPVAREQTPGHLNKCQCATSEHTAVSIALLPGLLSILSFTPSKNFHKTGNTMPCSGLSMENGAVLGITEDEQLSI